MSRDWTFEGQLSSIAEFEAGTDSAGGYSCCFLKKDGETTKIYMSSALEDWNSYIAYDSVATGIDGVPTALDYVEDGKLLVGTSAGKVYEVLVAPNAVASGFTLMFTDPNGDKVNRVSRGNGNDHRIVSSGSKVYTFPSAGGAETERLDAGAGSAVIDIALGADQGTMFVIRDIAGGTTLAAASSSWGVSKQDGDISASLRSSQVFNIDFDASTGRWIAGRASGENAETTELSNWVDLSSHSPLWVAAAHYGKISYATDGASWSNYTIPSPLHQGKITGIALGKDEGDNDLWIITREPDNSSSIREVVRSSDPTDINSWSEIEYLGSGNPNGANDVKYGNGVWVFIGDGGIDRSIDGGNTLIDTSGYSPPGPNLTIGDKSLSTDGAGSWVAVSHDGNSHTIFKSIDDGATWVLSYTIPIGYEGRQYRKQVQYGNDVWIVFTGLGGGFRCQAGDLDSNNWTPIAPVDQLSWTSDFQYGGNNTWVAVGSSYGWNHTSTDNGATWVQNGNIGSGNISNDPSFVAYDDGIWIAVTDDRIFRSSDNGSSWVQSQYLGGYSYGAVAINRVLPNI